MGHLPLSWWLVLACTPPPEAGAPKPPAPGSEPSSPPPFTSPTDPTTPIVTTPPTTPPLTGPDVTWSIGDTTSLDNGILRVRTERGILWFDFFHAGEGRWYDFRNDLTVAAFDLTGDVSASEGDQVHPDVELVSGDADGATLRLHYDFPNGVRAHADMTMARGDARVWFELHADPSSEGVSRWMWHVTFGQAESVKVLQFGDELVDVDTYELPLPGGPFQDQRVDWWRGIPEQDYVFQGYETAAPDPNNPDFLDRVLGLVQHVSIDPPLRAADAFGVEARDQPWQGSWSVPSDVPWIERLSFDRSDGLIDGDTLVYGIDNVDDFR